MQKELKIFCGCCSCFILVFIGLVLLLISQLPPDFFDTLSTANNIPTAREDTNTIVINTPFSEKTKESSSSLLNNTPAPLTPVQSLYNDNIYPEPIKKVKNIELKLSLQALQILQKRGWNGDVDSADLAASDFSSSFLDDMVALAAEKDKYAQTQLRIPSRYQELYLSNNAQQEIVNLLFTARQEYLDYLQKMHVAQSYITELESNVLPQSSNHFIYHAENNPDQAYTHTEGFVD